MGHIKDRAIMEPTTRIIDLTVGELELIISREIERRMPKPAPVREERPAETALYGIEGMAEALHCSTRQAQRWKSQGLLEGGYQQIGRGITVRSPQALRDIAERNMAAGCRKRRTRR